MVLKISRSQVGRPDGPTKGQPDGRTAFLCPTQTSFTEDKNAMKIYIFILALALFPLRAKTHETSIIVYITQIHPTNAIIQSETIWEYRKLLMCAPMSDGYAASY